MEINRISNGKYMNATVLGESFTSWTSCSGRGCSHKIYNELCTYDITFLNMTARISKSSRCYNESTVVIYYVPDATFSDKLLWAPYYVNVCILICVPILALTLTPIVPVCICLARDMCRPNDQKNTA